LFSRKTAYQLTFDTESESVKTVLRDLAKFCRANKSCFHADPRIHAVIEGRREVFLRIIEHLNMTPDEFWKKYGREDLP
jgi:hypothetical protein